MLAQALPCCTYADCRVWQVPAGCAACKGPHPDPDISEPPALPLCSAPRLLPQARLDAAGAAATAAYHVCPNLDLLVAAMQEGPLEELEQRCPLTPGGHRVPSRAGGRGASLGRSDGEERCGEKERVGGGWHWVWALGARAMPAFRGPEKPDKRNSVAAGLSICASHPHSLH